MEKVQLSPQEQQASLGHSCIEVTRSGRLNGRATRQKSNTKCSRRQPRQRWIDRIVRMLEVENREQLVNKKETIGFGSNGFEWSVRSQEEDRPYFEPKRAWENVLTTFFQATSLFRIRYIILKEILEKFEYFELSIQKQKCYLGAWFHSQKFCVKHFKYSILLMKIFLMY